ncbi:PAS domain S-box protein [Iningainema tapete]|uniref:histidine kinase n=1 Tax=Iningainema tapete BLCC-T55 TaxID=2748662 RepID=A0A8J6XIA4_9CYAN|nr:PAS domain S-box protein [Iningainema tapete]MBD2773770.1 PAS domain S-box protein [Iningainema tapete BLCC-T55]
MLKVNRLCQNNQEQTSLLKLVAQAASFLTIAIACMVMVIRGLNWDKGFFIVSTMNANAALCFILAGVSLWLSVWGVGEENNTSLTIPQTLLSRLCALGVYIIGWLTLSEWLFGWDIGIDRLWMTSSPERMGLNCAINFILLGRALELLSISKTDRSSWYVQIFAVFVVVISGVALMGYTYNEPILYSILPTTSPMTLLTAATFIVLSVGILWTRADKGFMRLVTSDTYSGVLARRLLVATIVVPLLLGWIILQGQLAELYESGLAISLLVIVLVSSFCVLIVLNAGLVEGLSNERDRVKIALREKEEKLNSLFEANAIGILFGNVDGGIQQANDKFLDIIGYDREDLVAGRISWIEITPPEYLELDKQRIAEAKADGACLPYEKEYIRKDGTRIPILVGYALLGENRVESVAFILDLSEQKRAEKALRNTEERFRLAVDNIPDIFSIYDAQLRFQFLNAEGLRRINKSKEEVFGCTDEEIFPPELTSGYIDILKTAKYSRTAQTKEVTVNLPGYGKFISLIKYIPILDDKGEIYQILGFAEDITARKQIEETLINQQKWLEEVLNLMPTPLLLIEPATARVMFANRAADEVAGGKFPLANSIAEYQTIYYSTDKAGNPIPNELTPGVRVARGERIEGLELDWHTPAGIRSLLVFADTLPAMHGHQATCVLVFQDITNLKRVEKALSLGYQRLQLLFNAASDLLSSQQPVALIDSLFRKLSEQIGLDVYFNYLIDEKLVLQLASYSGISEEKAKEVQSLELGKLVSGDVAYHRTPIAIEDVQQSINPKAEWIRSVGITAYYSYPLIAQGQLLGTMSFGSRSRLKFSQNEIGMMQAVCDQIAIAMERARLIASLQQQTEQLREANRMKDEFLAILSHELRSPLNAILGWAQLLRSRKLDEKKTAQAIETIERNAKAQTQLIGDLLDISRMIRGKLRLNIRNCDLVPIVEAAIETVRLAAEAKKIDLKFSLSPTPESQNAQLNNAINKGTQAKFLVSGDAERLQQVIWNLLSNAIKFTPNNGRVEVLLSQRVGETALHPGFPKQTTANPEGEPGSRGGVGETAQITVTDTGMGINAEFLPYVFDRFRQADSSSTRPHSGLGLGLAIVRHLVELHGGTVQVNSSGEGKGATFTVTLPLVEEIRGVGVMRSRGEEHSIQILDSNSCVTLPLLNNVKVLVVDDEDDTREYITIVLQQCQAQVKAVASARAALDVMQEWNPDVLVSDIAMPERDGYSLIREVRLREVSRNQRKIPAAALTAYARAEDRTRAIKEGFQMHVPKPVEPLELATVVASLAGRT